MSNPLSMNTPILDQLKRSLQIVKWLTGLQSKMGAIFTGVTASSQGKHQAQNFCGSASPRPITGLAA
jgi:hypothetical protein